MQQLDGEGAVVAASQQLNPTSSTLNLSAPPPTPSASPLPPPTSTNLSVNTTPQQQQHLQLLHSSISSSSTPPANAQQLSQGAPGSNHILHLSTEQAETLASLGLSALMSNPSTANHLTSPSDSASPQSPAFSQHSLESNVSPFTRTNLGNTTSVVSTPGSTSMTPMIPRALTHELELAYPGTPASLPSSSSGQNSTPSSAPPTPFYFSSAASTNGGGNGSGTGTPSGPPIGARATPPPNVVTSIPPIPSHIVPPPAHSAPPTHSGVPRHHPYAHPTHPRTSHSNQPSTSALPLYLSSSASASPILPQSSTLGGDNSALPSPSIPSPTTSSHLAGVHPLPPQRVHSAPAHILAVQDDLNQMEDERASFAHAQSTTPQPPPTLEQQHLQAQAQHAQVQAEWDARRIQQNGLLAAMDSAAANGDWEGDRGMSDGTGKEERQQQQQQQPPIASLQISHSSAPNMTPALTPDALGYYESGSNPAFNFPPPPMFQPGPVSHPPTIEMVVAASALLKNRLPILEAALTASTSEPGNDEEEIWKGVESAYKELKRIMNARKDARRGLSTIKPSAGRNFVMELENAPSSSSPMVSTPTSNAERPHAANIFLSTHPPPLMHSQSSPEGVPTLAAQRAAAQVQAQVQAQAQAATVQAIQHQQAVMQQQQQQQQQAQQQQQHHQAQMQQQMQQQQQAHAQAQAQQQALAQADAQARALAAAEEIRVQQEQAEQARAADDASRREQQMQQEQYQQAVAAQHQQQEAADRHVAEVQQAEHYRQQLEAQANAANAVAAQQQHQQQQQQQAYAAAAAAVAGLPSSSSSTLNGIVPSHLSMSMAPTALSMAAVSGPPQVAPLTSPISRELYGHVRQPTQATSTPFANAPPPIAYEHDVSMGAVMQMHLGASSSTPTNSATSAPPSAPSLPPSSFVDGVNQNTLDSANMRASASVTGFDELSRSNWKSNPAYAALTAAATSVVEPTLHAQCALPSPPNSGTTPTMTSRPPRSRAASGSGYVSASGSRSRAASGSGYQSLLGTRSRAASSASSVFGPPYEVDDEDELDEGDEFDDAVVMRYSATASSLSQATATVTPELRARMDPVFNEFLCDLCSNLDATDSKGEPIHQTLMAKKMERLDQSADFRPFKFRIQAFTSAFSERLLAAGISEIDIPIKRVRQYLWSLPCISRFNDDGKKAKSKGNHIWTIGAKKDPERRWVFREFVRCIKGTPPPVAFVGLPWTWAPRVWDPQASIPPADVTFTSSSSLPSWLHWQDHILTGEAPESAKGQTFEIDATAYIHGNIEPGKPNEVSASVTIVVASPSERAEALNIDMPADSSEPVSQIASPIMSSRDAFRSPTMRQSSFSDNETRPDMSELSQLHQQHQVEHMKPSLLPSLMPVSSRHSSISPTSNSESSFNIAFAQQQQEMVQQQQQHQQQLYDDAMTQAASAQIHQQHPQQTAMQLDGEVEAQDTVLEAQAALHRHYVNAMNSQGSAVSGGSLPPSASATLSFAPPPDLVTSALHQAQGNGSAPTSYANRLVHNHSEVGTPSMIEGRLRNVMLSSQQYSSLDTSNM